MAIGLAAILITIAVIVWIMSSFWIPQAQQAIAVNKTIKPKVQQIAGQDSDGQDARTTIKLDSESTGGKMTSVIVTDIDTEGAMARYFGLKKGDSIVEIAPQGGVLMSVKDMGGPGEAKDQLLSAYQNSQPIVVVREGQKMTLPVAPPPKASTVTSGTPLQQQLDAIGGQKAPTQ
jgi:hypothetical protein